MNPSSLWLLRFFIVVPLVPRGLILALASFTAVGITAIAVDPSYGGLASAPLLLLQTFATSAGFRVPARRGHYDLVLTRGIGRATIGMVHWALCATPGIFCWLVLAAAERVRGGQALSMPDTMLAVLVVSTVPWAITVPWQRTTGAIVLLFAWTVTGALSAGPHIVSPVAPYAAAFAACAIATVAVALRWICRIDIRLESGQ